MVKQRNPFAALPTQGSELHGTPFLAEVQHFTDRPYQQACRECVGCLMLGCDAEAGRLTPSNKVSKAGVLSILDIIKSRKQHQANTGVKGLLASFLAGGVMRKMMCIHNGLSCSQTPVTAGAIVVAMQGSSSDSRKQYLQAFGPSSTGRTSACGVCRPVTNWSTARCIAPSSRRLRSIASLRFYSIHCDE